LDLSQNTELGWLMCNENELTNLDLTLNSNLLYVNCQSNLLESLNIKNGNNTAITNNNFNAYLNPNLTCITVDDEAWSTSNWIYIDAQTSYSTDCAALGLEDRDMASAVRLYPNPVSNVLHIDSKIPLVKVELFSVFGKSVLTISSGFDAISMEHLSHGLYMVKLQFNDGYVIKKLIKK
jgi:hypothetical protein